MFYRQIDVRIVRFVSLIMDGDDSVKEDLNESKGKRSFLLSWDISLSGCHGDASYFLLRECAAGAGISSDPSITE